VLVATTTVAMGSLTRLSVVMDLGTRGAQTVGGRLIRPIEPVE